MMPSSKAPASVPPIDPLPPVSSVPPTTTEAMAKSSQPDALDRLARAKLRGEDHSRHARHAARDDIDDEDRAIDGKPHEARGFGAAAYR